MLNIKVTEQDMEKAILDDIYTRLQHGERVELDPETADRLGAFEETAITDEEVEEDRLFWASRGQSDGLYVVYEGDDDELEGSEGNDG